MENRENGLEQIQKQVSSSQAEEVRQLLDQGKFTQAESLAKEANLSPEDWAQVGSEADSSIRDLSEEPLPEGPISAEQAQKAVTGAEDTKILQYGEENMPGMKEVSELEGAVTESDQIIDEILELISKAKNSTAKNMWAKPVRLLTLPIGAVPIIADVYALLKGNKLRKQLKKLEKLNKKLTNPNFLNSDLKADKISPNMGHKLTLTGTGAVAAGAIALKASTVALGAGAATTFAVTNPIGAGVGAGLVLAGGVAALAGTIKQVIDFANMSGTSQSLKDLEKRLLETRDKNQSSRQQIYAVKDSYVQGARENLQPMMA